MVVFDELPKGLITVGLSHVLTSIGARCSSWPMSRQQSVILLFLRLNASTMGDNWAFHSVEADCYLVKDFRLFWENPAQCCTVPESSACQSTG